MRRRGWPQDRPRRAASAPPTWSADHRPGGRLLGLGGGQPQQQSCGTRATREAGKQQLQAPQRAHVMVVSVCEKVR